MDGWADLSVNWFRGYNSVEKYLRCSAGALDCKSVLMDNTALYNLHVHVLKDSHGQKTEL